MIPPPPSLLTDDVRAHPQLGAPLSAHPLVHHYSHEPLSHAHPVTLPLLPAVHLP
jgi:hypothetical protein